MSNGAVAKQDQRTRRSSSSMDQSSTSNSTTNNGNASNNNNNNNNKTASPFKQAGPSNQSGNIRRRHRRACKGGEKHRRKWKPYDKLSWEEKRLLGEKEAQSAEKRREDALRLGHPVAPFNTTQFIMEEHSGGKGITPRMVASRSLNASGTGSGHGSGFCSQQDTPIRDDNDNDNEYFEREYSAALETVRAERLQSMNSQQLRAEVLRLEVEIDALNKKNHTMLATKDSEITELRSEIARLKEFMTRFSELANQEITTTTTQTTTVKVNVDEMEQEAKKNNTEKDNTNEPVSPKAL